MMRMLVILLMVFGAAGGACAAGAPAASAEVAGEPPVGESGASAESVGEPAPSDDTPPAGAESEFSTDFTLHSVPYDEVLSGGPPKDGIAAIDEPTFVSVDEADAWLRPMEPVVLLEIDSEAKAYPIQILMWHEIVNDELGGVPVTVTFCPRCNTAVGFKRRIANQVMDFGTSGRLRNSNMIMYDRQTETWWQQATGEGIVGELTGRQLRMVPVMIISWDEFRGSYSDGLVLSRDTGFDREYGSNRYVGYDDIDADPFLYRGPTPDGRLPAMARVMTVEIDGEAVAYPYQIMEQKRLVNDKVGEEQVLVLWQPGTASALDTDSVSGGRDVGTVLAFSRVLDGRALYFMYDGDRIVDRQTKSEWDHMGRSVGGRLAGNRLDALVAINHFWFSWAAFKPDTRIYTPEE